MGYWEQIGSMNKLIKFAKDWKTIKEVREEFKLSSVDSWKLFRRIVKKYDEFEYRDTNGIKAGTPVIFKATSEAYNKMLIETKKEDKK